jgi:two-component system, NarL family, sensor kinase
MRDQNQEIFVVALLGIVLALLLVGFILTILFLYQRRQHRQEKELAHLKDQFDQELLRSQLEIQEATFKTIAQELHDNIGQVLSVIKLWLAILPVTKEDAAYEGVQNSREMLNKVIFDLADLTKSLHTDRITEIGLPEAIQFDLEILRKTGLFEINFSVQGSPFAFDPQKSIFVFRMFQEMMNNIVKHSKAAHVNVSVIYHQDFKFVLKVEDDGVGFNLESKQKAVASTAGIGLRNMRNRAKLIGGEVIMESQPGAGTQISIELPLK